MAYYPGYGEDDDNCACSPYADCQQDQNDEINCECSENAPCQQPEDMICECSRDAMCKKSPNEQELMNLTSVGVIRPEIQQVDLDPLLEEPYSNIDTTNSQVLIVDVPDNGESDGYGGANGDVMLYDPDDLFLFVSPQSHNLVVQRQRLLDTYIEDLAISEVEEAAVALRVLINLFRQRRMDMNKLVPLFQMGEEAGGNNTLGCGCPQT